MESLPSSLTSAASSQLSCDGLPRKRYPRMRMGSVIRSDEEVAEEVDPVGYGELAIVVDIGRVLAVELRRAPEEEVPEDAYGIGNREGAARVDIAARERGRRSQPAEEKSCKQSGYRGGCLQISAHKESSWP